MSVTKHSKKVFNGNDVSPLYYVAVLLYLVKRLRSDSQVNELFDTVKRLFLEAIHEEPPPQLLIAFSY